jgi:hypothetical protein
MACEVEAPEKVKLGKGYSGYLIIAPNGETFVAESITGAFVGPTVEEVINDIKVAERKVMKKQIEMAKEQVKNAELISEDKFWETLKCNVG